MLGNLRTCTHTQGYISQLSLKLIFSSVYWWIELRFSYFDLKWKITARPLLHKATLSLYPTLGWRVALFMIGPDRWRNPIFATCEFLFDVARTAMQPLLLHLYYDFRLLPLHFNISLCFIVIHLDTYHRTKQSMQLNYQTNTATMQTRTQIQSLFPCNKRRNNGCFASNILALAFIVSLTSFFLHPLFCAIHIPNFLSNCILLLKMFF